MNDERQTELEMPGSAITGCLVGALFLAVAIAVFSLLVFLIPILLN